MEGAWFRLREGLTGSDIPLMTWLSWIKRDDRGRVNLGKFESWLHGLIVLNLIAFAVETIETLPADVQSFLAKLEVVSTVVFALEYGIRVGWSRPRLGYVRSFYGIVDLLSILPSLLMLGWDMRSIRIFRLLRLLRIFKLARYSAAVRRFRRAYEIAREELALFGAVALIVLYLAGVGIYQFEHDAQPEVFSSVFHCLWWATTTLTTVGYGDAFPITAGGRIFTFFVLVVGLAIVAVPTGLMASALTQARDDEKEK